MTFNFSCKVVVLFLLGVLKLVASIKAPLSESQLVLLPEKSTFDKAFELCKQKNMRLIKIDDEETNGVVYYFAKDEAVNHYWIDGNDIKEEGKWVHKDGSELVYKNWNKDQPDNSNKNEHCLHGMVGNGGKWNDIVCTSSMSVICYPEEKPIVTTPKPIVTTPKPAPQIKKPLSESQLVLLPEKSTFDKAFELCQKKNMRLVKIDDEETNGVVYYFAKDEAVNHYWIDGNDIKEEGKWVHKDGSELVYKNWNAKQPDNTNKIEHCLHGMVGNSGKWNDIDCTSSMSVICYS